MKLTSATLRRLFSSSTTSDSKVLDATDLLKRLISLSSLLLLSSFSLSSSIVHDDDDSLEVEVEKYRCL